MCSSCVLDNILPDFTDKSLSKGTRQVRSLLLSFESQQRKHHTSETQQLISKHTFLFTATSLHCQCSAVQWLQWLPAARRSRVRLLGLYVWKPMTPESGCDPRGQKTASTSPRDPEGCQAPWKQHEVIIIQAPLPLRVLSA